MFDCTKPRFSETKPVVKNGLILYVPVNHFLIVLGQLLGLTSTKQGIKCLAQGNNTIPNSHLFCVDGFPLYFLNKNYFKYNKNQRNELSKLDF